MAASGPSGDRLQELLDKQDIHEVLARYCRGLDRGDYELVRTAFHPDAVYDHGGIVQPVSEFLELLKRPGRKILKAVSHNLTNEFMTLDEDVAHCESYALACHRLEHDGAEWTWIVGQRYLDRLERRDGAWRIAHRTDVYDWARVDRVSDDPAGPAIAQSTDNGYWGRGDREDVSYQRGPDLT